MSVTVDAAVDACADDLFLARQDGVAIPPVRTRLPEADIEAAYRVQQRNVDRLRRGGSLIVGRKIGLTSEAVQKQLGVDRPDFGVLFDFMHMGGEGANIAVSRLISPRVEAEFAFRLGADITEAGLGAAGVAVCVADVCVAAEIVDSAIAGWDINIVDTVADNASCGAFVAGPWVPFDVALDLPRRVMRMTRDGQTISEGRGAATLGDPLNALAWLADTAVTYGEPLRAGEIVLAGALGPMVGLTPGDYAIEIEGFATLSFRAQP
ncbi:2-keto-4-pentenoate hydratase [Phenylobacterium sp.]|uniref:2-keto-4-pentenoate hydratase n=1 Tax=Phenylobacterium sp. TaxID=1871053 RepID=UPI0035ADC49F